MIALSDQTPTVDHTLSARVVSLKFSCSFCDENSIATTARFPPRWQDVTEILVLRNFHGVLSFSG